MIVRFWRGSKEKGSRFLGRGTIAGELEDSPFRRLRGAGSVQMTTDEIMALTRGEK